MAKGNYAENWNKDYQPLTTTFRGNEIKSRDDFYQKLGYEYTYEDIVKNIKKPLHEIRVLEIGCGGARTSVYLAGRGMQTTGTDISQEALRLAEANFRKENITNYNLVIDDICNTKLPKESFDVVMSFGLLEHFHDIEKPIIEMTKLLKPGGVHIHDIITGRLSLGTVSLLWNSCARFLKRLVTGRWGNIIHESRRNFRHYENSYSLAQYVRTFEKSGTEVLFEGGMVIWSFMALPKVLQRALVRWAVRNENFFRRIDRSQSKFMEIAGPCWWVVAKKD